jgi:hypothetical protein
VFSILHDRWLRHPTAAKPAIDDSAVRQKRDAWASVIDGLLAGEPEAAEVDAALSRLRTMRQNGLHDGGEFSVENLAWKALRDGNLLNRLYAKKTELRNQELSL